MELRAIAQEFLNDIYFNSNFKASKDIMTKFKSEALYIIRIIYLKAIVRVATIPPSLPPSATGILRHKQATHAKNVGPECTY